MEKGYCEICDKLTNFIKKEIPEKAQIHGKFYSYQKLIAYCPDCKNEVTVPSIQDENLRRIDESYRKAENIITLNGINQILEKYNIGKKPLAKLLGWGEVTIIRYINGDVPTKIYSNELYKILKNPVYMEEILESNKNNISHKCYNSVKNAILNLKNTSSSSTKLESDIDLISEYIIKTCKEITPLALQKILYYSQGFFMAFFGTPLFQDDCEAWVHGPVYSKIYDKYKVFGSSNIVSDFSSDLDSETFSDIDSNIFDNTEINLDKNKQELIDFVIKYFAVFSGRALENMTHNEAPWQIARNGLFVDEKTNKIIEKGNIKRFFDEIKEKYEMRDLSDIKKYSEVMFFKAVN